MEGQGADSRSQKNIAKILPKVSSPLRLFALVIMICNSSFAIVAASMDNKEGFVYSIHMFLAIVGAFVLISLWSPRSLYHPKELLDIPADQMPESRPGVATFILCVALIGYTVYQAITP